MESIHLIGAEQIQSAGRNMSGAADQMSQAATNLDGALERHQRFMDDWLQRFEGVMFAHARMMGEEPTPLLQETPPAPTAARDQQDAWECQKPTDIGPCTLRKGHEGPCDGIPF